MALKSPKASAPQVISRSNFKYMYWSSVQQLVHHASSGCAMNVGDLLGSGTQSGPEPESAGSLLELSGGGKTAIALPNGEQRTFLEDGDTVVLRGRAVRPGLPRIGFGEAAGTVLPAR